MTKIATGFGRKRKLPIERRVIGVGEQPLELGIRRSGRLRYPREQAEDERPTPMSYDRSKTQHELIPHTGSTANAWRELSGCLGK